MAIDIPLFQGIVGDLFPGISAGAAAYGSLESAIRAAAKARCLQDTEPFVAKVLQLYEMVNCRHGLMLVGPPLAAKTSTARVLAAALSQLAESGDARGEQSVETHVLNPKSLELAELYGSFDAVSHEFTDGVLGRIFRDCASGTRTAGRQWLIFDGPVDAEWIENMNTVLDDNKKLCLLNGEVIQMAEGMNLIFETDDLSQASPATVSRCGMVYLEPAMLGVHSHLQSWLTKLPTLLTSEAGPVVTEPVVQRVTDLFEALFSKCTDFIFTSCTTVTPGSEVQLARCLMGILEAQLTAQDFLFVLQDSRSRPSDILCRLDMYFLYALVWSVGALTDEAGQRAFSEHLRKQAQSVHQLAQSRLLKFERTSLIPDGGQNVQEYFVEQTRWSSWREQLRIAPAPSGLHSGSSASA